MKTNFWKSEDDRVKKEKKEAFEKKGWKTFFNFPQGTTKVTVDLKVEPRKTQTGKPILRGSVDGTVYDIPITSVVYGKIIEFINDGAVTFNITRVGTGKQDTRYGVEIAGSDQ